MHLVRTCIVTFILTFRFFNQSVSHKKIEKVIEDEIYSKLFEIYKETEKVVLLKFVEAIPFSGRHFFQWKGLLLVETSYILFTGSHSF